MNNAKLNVIKRFRRPASHAARRWTPGWLSSAPQPGAESLMADIMELNPGATVGFLSSFKPSELRAYRDRLAMVSSPAQPSLI